ncbi:hypothetical protein [Rufibacter sp. XAAS-G3-1]|uniref:hypothetical protein n=1 Tax=Rufibacter sp. XAAS-G3-1 TaxID=2729134 RepID=UPI0015E660C3|nr:hypothetical protein [Rufibacter sp. XAAS-G3-1]
MPPENAAEGCFFTSVGLSATVVTGSATAACCTGATATAGGVVFFWVAAVGATGFLCVEAVAAVFGFADATVADFAFAGEAVADAVFAFACTAGVDVFVLVCAETLSDAKHTIPVKVSARNPGKKVNFFITVISERVKKCVEGVKMNARVMRMFERPFLTILISVPASLDTVKRSYPYFFLEKFREPISFCPMYSQKKP